MAEPVPSALPLVLVHGVGQGPMAWQPVVDIIGSSRPVLAPWLQGLRPGRHEPFDLDAAAGAVARQIQLHGHERVALVGVSLGAVVAARLAAAEPELVDRLLLASPPVSPPGWVMAAQRCLVAVTPRGVFTRQGVTKEAVRSAMAAVGTVDLRPDLARLQSAPLVVVGSGDRSARMAVAEVERRLPAASSRVLDGAGHDLLREAGPRFGRIIADWVAAA